MSWEPARLITVTYVLCFKNICERVLCFKKIYKHVVLQVFQALLLYYYHSFIWMVMSCSVPKNALYCRHSHDVLYGRNSKVHSMVDIHKECPLWPTFKNTLCGQHSLRMSLVTGVQKCPLYKSLGSLDSL